MTRFAPVVLLLAAVTSVGGQPPPKPPVADPDPRSPKGVFGKPCPHGEPIEKAFLGLYAGRTRLAFGQPMRVDLFAVAATKDGPHINPRLDDGRTLELTDAAGKPVPFRLEDGGYSGGNGLERIPFTLWPTKDHALGVYWKPGTYKLKATITNPKDPANRNPIPGTFKSNELTFTVREPGAALDTWDGKGKLRRAGGDEFSGPDDIHLFVAGLDEKSVARLLKNGIEPFNGMPGALSLALFAPVTVPQDRKLTDAEVKKLVADLKHDDPAVRILAVRSVPPTAPAEVFAAAVRLLADDYEQDATAPFSHGGVFYPVSPAAADALARLGPPVVEPLLAFAEEKGHKARQFQLPPRTQAAALLGRIGPTDAAGKYLRAAIQSGDADRVAAALATAKAWGKGGVEHVRAIVALPKLSGETRAAAIATLGQSGDLKTDGPTLRKLIAAAEPETQWAAIAALVELRDTGTLPEFERLSRDVKTDGQTRQAAMHAVLALADAKTGERLVLDLIGQKEDGNLRYEALGQARRRKITAALPLALDALDDPEGPTRWEADRVLRELTDHPAGVGYDGEKPDAKLWRDFCAKRKR